MFRDSGGLKMTSGRGVDMFDMELEDFGQSRRKQFGKVIGAAIVVAAVAGLLLLAWSQLGSWWQTRTNPTRAAEVWLEAVVDLDGKRVEKLSCLYAPVGAQAVLQMLASADELPALLRDVAPDGGGDAERQLREVLKRIELDISRLEFETLEETEVSASVRMSGPLVITAFNIHVPVPIDQVWLMEREDGVWKWCGWPQG